MKLTIWLWVHVSSVPNVTRVAPSRVSSGTAIPIKNPPHPGRIVPQDCIEALELTVTKTAELLGVTRQVSSVNRFWRKAVLDFLRGGIIFL